LKKPVFSINSITKIVKKASQIKKKILKQSNMATTNLTNNTVNNNNQQPMDTNTAAAILAQFDQNTQLQALAMLRQLNAQQQLQQIQRLQQLQQLQAFQALQRISIDDKNEGTNHVVNDNTKMVISSATRPPKQMLSQSNSLSSSGQGRNTGSISGNQSGNFAPSFNNKEIYTPTVKINNNKISSSSFQVSNNKSLSPRSSMIGSNYTTATSNNLTFQPIKKEIGPDGEEFIVPSDDMIDQIVIASEYYFSDENLAKDHYLLRQICQKSEGFLSIKLLTALKNVKRLTKDWRVTSAALKKSTKLLLNNECTKVKRIAALPDHVLKARQITNVIAIRIPMEFSSVSSITQLFAQFGKITLVRVLLPGRQVPCDLRNYATQVPDMGNSLCAVVEYETETEACTACRDLNAKRYNSGLRAALLGPRLRRNLYKAIPESEQTGDNFNNNQATSFPELSTNNNTWNKAVVVNGSAQIIDAKAQKGTSLNSSSGVSSGKNGNTKDSGCDSASNHSSSSPPSLRKDTFDRAPGAHRKSVKMQINISSNNVAVIRQPKGPTSGNGFSKMRSIGVAC